MSGFVPIKEALKRAPQRGPTKPILLALQIEKTLRQLLPKLFPKITESIKMRSLREGQLTVSTPSPAASQEIFLHGEKIKKALNEEVGEKVVEKISVKIRTQD